MSTVGTVVDRTLRQLMSGTVEELNKTVGALTAASTSIVLWGLSAEVSQSRSQRLAEIVHFLYSFSEVRGKLAS